MCVGIWVLCKGALSTDMWRNITVCCVSMCVHMCMGGVHMCRVVCLCVHVCTGCVQCVWGVAHM
jgi:hypothetical protein